MLGIGSCWEGALYCGFRSFSSEAMVKGRALVVLLVVALCATMAPMALSETVKIATCKMVENCGQPTCVTGQITFKQKESGGPTTMSGLLRGVLPIGEHGWHVHEFAIRNTTGGCGSTGGHFNPFGTTHGAPDAEIRHVGDFGNFVSQGKSGWAFLKQSDDLASLVGDPNTSVLGRALVIHGGKDDLGLGTGEAMEGSLANGNAGPRIGCCEIKLKE